MSGGSIYLIPYIRYVFYDHQIQAMGITNQQLGLLTSIYAIGAMILYAPGGIIADRTSPKKCMVGSLLATTFLTILYAFNMGYTISLVIWLLLAITTTFVFWTALFKSIRILGNEEEQGFLFGLYYAGNGIVGAVVNGIAIWATQFTTDMRTQFVIAVLIYAASTGIAAIMLMVFLKEDPDELKAIKVNDFKMNQVVDLLKNPTIWVFAVIIFSAYSIYSSTSYFTPYLTDVVGISTEDSGILSIFRSYLFYILAPLSGLFADKVIKSTSKWFITLFGVLTLLFIGVLFIPKEASVAFVSVYTLLPGAVGLALYGIVFSIANEMRIPVAMMGTAVGIVSIIGYSPDFFMATMFGTWLDQMGSAGYTNIFIFLAGVSFVGVMASYYVRKKVVASNQVLSETSVSAEAE